MAAQLAEPIEPMAQQPQAEADSYGDFACQMQGLQAQQPGAAGDATLMATPLLAQACAVALLRYWQSGVERGAMNPDKPFYIVDLAPAQGQFAWLLLKALRARLDQRQRAWTICLLACCDSRAAGAALLAHPYLGDFVAQGWLDAVSVGAADGAGLALQRGGIDLLQTDNPLALLGLGLFQTLPSDLFGVHHGKLFEGVLAVTPESGASSGPTAPDQASHGTGHTLRYQWQPAPLLAPVLAPLLAPLFDYYLGRLHSAPLLMPSLALTLLQRLRHIAGGRYLLMACDPGVCDELALRLGGLTPPARWDADSAALPVNFHALSLSQRQHGAAVCNLAAGDDGLILHLACCDAGAEVDADHFERLCGDLQAAHPAHNASLRQLASGGAQPAAMHDMLALLHLSAYDPAVLQQLCRAWSGKALKLDDSARRAWLRALEASWSNFMPLQLCDDFHIDCALFAMQLGHWGQAQECMRLGLAFYGEQAHDLYLLAWCEDASGAGARALEHVQAALALDPAHAGAQELHARLAGKLQGWRDCPWYQADLAADAELRLEPLGAEHAASLLYQYRDEQISAMTRLPALDSIEQTQAWMAEQAAETGRISFAVMHASWGLVGIVSCQCVGQAGHFYYWIGSDYQQRGYGQRAAPLLFQQLAAYGVTEIYSSVDKANPQSLHLMRKLGFQQMALDALPPDDGEFFYYLGRVSDQRIAIRNFQQLCMDLGFPINRIAP